MTPAEREIAPNCREIVAKCSSSWQTLFLSLITGCEHARRRRRRRRGREEKKRKEATEQQEGAFDVWQFGKKEEKRGNVFSFGC